MALGRERYMAGSRPSQFKGGGGFLSDVDGVLVNYEFTDEYPGADEKPRKSKKDDDFRPLYAVLTVKVDGAEDEVTTTLFAGSADDFEIENDGHSLVPEDPQGGVSKNSDWGKFVASAVENGFPEEELPEDEINFESLLNKRYRFGQEVVIDKKTGKARQRVAKKGKFAGKSFDVTRTVITAYYGEADGKASKSSKGDKASKGKDTKTKGKKDDNEALYEIADPALVSILEAAKDHKVQKVKLSMKILNALLKHKNREALREMMLTDEYLERENGWTYDADAQVVELAEDDE